MPDSDRRFTIISAISTIVSSLAWSALFALFYRIPVPFAGYVGPQGEIGIEGFDTIVGLLAQIGFAWIFYSILGGFIVHFAVVKLAAFTGRHFGGRPIVIAVAAVLSLFPVLTMSVLDKFIGPW